jgi:hypothetical protein
LAACLHHTNQLLLLLLLLCPIHYCNNRPVCHTSPTLVACLHHTNQLLLLLLMLLLWLLWLCRLLSQAAELFQHSLPWWPACPACLQQLASRAEGAHVSVLAARAHRLGCGEVQRLRAQPCHLHACARPA